MGTMILNDVFDVEEDKINNLDKPIANGSVGRVPAAISGTICLILSVYLSYLIDIKFSICVLICALICAFYSPFLKPYGIIKNLSTCFVTSLIIFSLFRYIPKSHNCAQEMLKITMDNETSQNGKDHNLHENPEYESCSTPETLVTHIMVSSFLFFWNFSDELMMDIRDFEGDKASGINTFVVQIGRKLGFLCSCLSTRIVDVWSYNLEEEIDKVCKIVEDFPYISMDTEFPGVIGKAVGKFDSLSEFRYQTLKFNVDRLKIIQLGLTFSDSEGNLPEGVCTWQFNFQFNLNVDVYAQDSIDLLIHSGIKFKKMITDGIDQNRFAELLISSGLVLNDSVYWLSFHSSYDFGYLIKLLTTQLLPMTKNQFFEYLWDFFPNIYDIKYLMLALGPLHGGLQSMANQLGLKRVGTQHQAGSDSLLTSGVYFSLIDVYFKKVVDNEFLGKLYGLSDGYSSTKMQFSPNNNLIY
ncbi:hypothetical protein M0812_23190 [Anaeramoeba flamelloides]|uniref:poly(A)-specific ribonuclease n=1 Tax=Anaeramoeba flamelloides TaxID=1746091 RepID=A0AAV7YR67_9EUKA|nr:hypothetical protein M0812_23190 [Anaeramoeba flamelloides]